MLPTALKAAETTLCKRESEQKENKIKKKNVSNPLIENKYYRRVVKRNLNAI